MKKLYGRPYAPPYDLVPDACYQVMPGMARAVAEGWRLGGASCGPLDLLKARVRLGAVPVDSYPTEHGWVTRYAIPPDRAAWIAEASAILDDIHRPR